MSHSELLNRSYDFVIDITNLAGVLKERNEYLISTEICRSGIDVGVNIYQAQHAESIEDFSHYLSVALQKANVTDYWLKLLLNSGDIDEVTYKRINKNCSDIMRMLISAVKTTRKKMGRYNP